MQRQVIAQLNSDFGQQRLALGYGGALNSDMVAELRVKSLPFFFGRVPQHRIAVPPIELTQQLTHLLGRPRLGNTEFQFGEMLSMAVALGRSITPLDRPARREDKPHRRTDPGARGQQPVEMMQHRQCDTCQRNGKSDRDQHHGHRRGARDDHRRSEPIPEQTACGF